MKQQKEATTVVAIVIVKKKLDFDHTQIDQRQGAEENNWFDLMQKITLYPLHYYFYICLFRALILIDFTSDIIRWIAYKNKYIDLNDFDKFLMLVLLVMLYVSFKNIDKLNIF